MLVRCRQGGLCGTLGNHFVLTYRQTDRRTSILFPEHEISSFIQNELVSEKAVLMEIH